MDATIKKYDNFTINTKFVKVPVLASSDFGIQFTSGNVRYVLKYVDNKLHFYVVVNDMFYTNEPLSHIYNVFNEIHEIDAGNFHIGNSSFYALGKNKIKLVYYKNKARLGIEFIRQSNKHSLFIYCLGFGQPMIIFVSDNDNYSYSRVEFADKLCQSKIRLFSLCYVLKYDARDKIVAHCLQHFLDTYFTTIPTDILHFIFNYIIG